MWIHRSLSGSHSGESFEIGAGLVTDLPVITFSADGSLVAFGSVGPGVEVWSVEELRRVMDVEGFGPDFADDGLMSHGFCTGGEGLFEDCEVRIVDPESGQLVGAFPSDVPPFFTAWSPDGSRIVMANQDTAVVRDAETGDEISRTNVDRVTRRGGFRPVKPSWPAPSRFLGSLMQPPGRCSWSS